MYVLSVDLRLSHVLEMWIDILWGYQTLLHNWVVIKVAFGFVLIHAARHQSIKMGFAPLYLREISLGPSSDRIQKCMTMLHMVKS